MSGAEVLVWLRWTGWSESSADTQPQESVPSSARNKCALISSVNRPCEASENQIFKFVHLLGNQTCLWPKQLLSLWERPDLVHKQALGWGGGSWPAHGAALPALATSYQHLPHVQVSKRRFRPSRSSLHPRVRVEARVWGKGSKHRLSKPRVGPRQHFHAWTNSKYLCPQVRVIKQCSQNSQPAGN